MERRGSIDVVQPGGVVHVAGKTYESADETEEQTAGFTSHTFQHALLATGGLMSPLNPRPGRNVHSMLVGPAAHDGEKAHLTPLQAVANELASTADGLTAPHFFRQNAAADTKHFTQVSASWNQALLLTHTGDVYQWILNDDTPASGSSIRSRDTTKGVAVDLRSPTVAKPARAHSAPHTRVQPGASAAALGPLLVAALCWERALKGCKIVSIACGPQHCLALTDAPLHDVYSWGVGADGRLGHGDFSRDEGVPRVIAALIPYRVTAISAGGSHCAVLTMGGVELGDLESAERSKLLNKITSQASRADHVALDSSVWALQRLAGCMMGRHKSAPSPEQCLGQVWTWGKGSHGRLGHGNETSIAEPKRVQGMVRLTHRAIQPLSSTTGTEAGGGGGGGGGAGGGQALIAPARPPLLSAMSASSMMPTKGMQRVDSLPQTAAAGGAGAAALADDSSSIVSGGVDSQDGGGVGGDVGGAAAPGPAKEGRTKASSSWLRAFNRTTASAPTPTAASTPRPTGPSSAEAAALLNLLTPYEEARIGLRTPVGGPYSGASLIKPRNGRHAASAKGLTPGAPGYTVLPILKDRPIATTVACGRNFTTVVTADGDVWAWGKAGEGQCGVDAGYLSTLASQHAVQQKESGKESRSKLPAPAITHSHDLLRPHRVVFPQPQFQHSARDIRVCARAVHARAAAGGPCAALHATLNCPWTLQSAPLCVSHASKVAEDTAAEERGVPQQEAALVADEPRPDAGARARARIDSLDAAVAETAEKDRKRAMRGGVPTGGEDRGSAGAGSLQEEVGQGEDDRFSTFSSVDGEGGEAVEDVSVSDGIDPLAWATRAAPMSYAQQVAQETQGSGMYEIGEDEARVHSLSAGHAHVVACSRDGAVWAWGANHFGQVGVGRLNLMVKHPANVPVQLYLQAHQDTLDREESVGGSGAGDGQSPCDPIVGVCAGAFHSVAFTAGGQVLSWGANSDGQLGSGDSCEQQAPEVVRPVVSKGVNRNPPGTEAGGDEGQGAAWAYRPWGSIECIGAGKNFTLLLEGPRVSLPVDAVQTAPVLTSSTGDAAAREEEVVSAGQMKRSHSAPSEALLSQPQPVKGRAASDASLSSVPADIPEEEESTGGPAGDRDRGQGDLQARRPSLGMKSVESSHGTTTTSGGAERPPPIHKSRGVRYGRTGGGVPKETRVSAGALAAGGGGPRGTPSATGMRRRGVSTQDGLMGLDGLSLGPALLLDAEEALLAKMSKLRVSRRLVDELRQGTCGAEWVHQMEGMAGAWAAFASSEARVQSLWRNGIPPSLRCRVWSLAVGNPTRVTPALFHMCLERATAILKQQGSGAGPSTVMQSDAKAVARDGLLSPVKAIDFEGEMGGAAPPPGGGAQASPTLVTPVQKARPQGVQPVVLAWGRESSASLVRMDLLRTFPQLRLFGPPGSHSEGPLHAHVRDVLCALACLRPDIGYIQGMSYIAAAIALHTSGAAVASVPVVTSRPGLPLAGSTASSSTLPAPPSSQTNGAGTPGPDASGSSAGGKKDRAMSARSPLQHKYSAAPSPVPAIGGGFGGGLASPSAGTGGAAAPAATPLVDASPFKSSPDSSMQPYSRAVTALTAVYLPLLHALRLTANDEGAKLPTAMIKRTVEADTENGAKGSSAGAKQLAGLYAAASPPTGTTGTGAFGGGGAGGAGDLGSPKPSLTAGFSASSRALDSKAASDSARSDSGEYLLTVADDRYLTFQLLVNLLGHSHIHAFFTMDPGPLAPYYSAFDRLLAMKRPALAKHISSCGISSEMYVFGWFQTLFLKALPLACALRVVDVFLLDGLPHLYKTAVAVLDRLSEYLLGEGSSFEDTIQVLTSAPSKAGVWEAAVSDPMLLAEAIEAVELPPEIVVELEDIGGDPFFYRHVAMAGTGMRG